MEIYMPLLVACTNIFMNWRKTSNAPRDQSAEPSGEAAAGWRVGGSHWSQGGLHITAYPNSHHTDVQQWGSSERLLGAARVPGIR